MVALGEDGEVNLTFHVGFLGRSLSCSSVSDPSLFTKMNFLVAFHRPLIPSSWPLQRALSLQKNVKEDSFQ